MRYDDVKIAVRGWPDYKPEPYESREFRLHKMLHKLLVFDTESVTDGGLRLQFGSAQIAWMTTGKIPRYRDVPQITKEVIFYADDLPVTDPGGFCVLENYCRERELALISQHDFVTKYLWQCAPIGRKPARACLTGFNVPHDVAQVAYGYGQPKDDSLRDGFAFRMYTDSDPLHPTFTIKHLDSKKYLSRGFNNLDVRTLIWALTNQSVSLRKGCEMFGLPEQFSKGHAEAYGIITPEFIDYNRQDVTATAHLALAALRQYRDHPIRLAPQRAMSPASIGKSYLNAMNITPMFSRGFPSDPRLLGNLISSFYGGRAECRIRNTPVPIALCDFTSMYPTVNANMKLWDVVTATKLRITDCTDKARNFFKGITLDQLLQPETWPHLRGFALVQPDGDVLPVRGYYDDTGIPTVGLNYLKSEQPLWYTFPDIASSVILTGKVPTILRACELVPGRKLTGMRNTALMNRIHVNPRKEDFFTRVIEQRAAVKKEHSKPVPPDCSCDRCNTASGLKTIANATSYGVYIEINRDDMTEPGNQRIHGASDIPWSYDGTAYEKPGTYCYPPVGALITGAARLMLALLEKLVTDAGGSYAMTDTDSMAIVASATGGEKPCDGVTALPWTVVESIRDRISTLNPYNPALVPDLLKIETPPGTWLYGISAKRYTLFTYDNGKPVVPLNIDGKRAYMEHALGLYLNPSDIDNPDRDWMRQAWQYIIDGAHGLSPDYPAWCPAIALTRQSATSPFLMRSFRDWNKNRDYRNQVKPFNFMLLVSEIPQNFQTRGRRMLTGYSTSPAEWETADWRNLREPDAGNYHIDTDFAVKAMIQVLRAYPARREAKSLAPDGKPCSPLTAGLLLRRRIRAVQVTHIGKESNKIELQLSEMIADAGEVMTDYGAPIPGQEAVTETRFCECGCGNPVRQGRKFYSKTHYERYRATRYTAAVTTIDNLGFDENLLDAA